MQNAKQERSLGELLTELSRETSTLVRQEVELAKTEMTHKATQVGKNVGSLVVGGAVAYAGFLVILAAIVIGLSAFMPAWVSALVVGVVVAGVGYFLAQQGIENLKRANLAPQETIQTLKEDAEWAKKQVT